jgi:hypothetical protein
MNATEEAIFEDPQIEVTGRLKTSARTGTEVIVFSVCLLMFELVGIVTIPEEGTARAPVYLKFKINREGHRQRY